MFDNEVLPPFHLIQPRCSILCSLDKFQYLTENEKNKKKKKEKRKSTVLVHICQQFHLWSKEIRETENERVHQQKDDQFNQYKEQVRGKNPRAHILVDQDQLTGHSQGQYSSNRIE